MRKFLTFLMLLVLMAPYALRADEIIIGNGTKTGNAAPFNNYYEHSWTEMIYPASEIGQSGFINSIAFKNTTPGQTLNVNDLRIYIGETTRTEISNTRDWTPENDLTCVFDGARTIGGNAGWEEYVFNTPFLYEGEQNIVIVVGKSSSGYNSALKYEYTSVENSCMYNRGDGGTHIAKAFHPGNAEGILKSYRANLKINMTPTDVSCYRVKPRFVGSTGSTITVEWDARDGQSNWDLYLTQNNIAPNENTVPTHTSTEPTYTFTGLNSAEAYTIYVRTNCGSSVSDWRKVLGATIYDFDGEGTANNPYKIYSKDELRALSNIVSNGYDATGEHYILLSNIDNMDFCISTVSNPFTGIFDGNNLTINLNLEGRLNIALFQGIGPNAVIKNLTTTGKVTVQEGSSAALVANASLVGAIGSGQDIYIQNCINRAEIVSDGGNSIGGIISTVEKISSNEFGNRVYVEDCINYGLINAGSSAFTGGVAGYTKSYTTVERCFNFATIIGKEVVSGVVGYAEDYCVIINSGNSGLIKPTGTSTIAGVCSSPRNSKIINCYNTGNIEMNYGEYIGGIAASPYRSSDSDFGEITNCYNGGTITGANGAFTGSIFGRLWNGYTVTNAYYKEGTHFRAYDPAGNPNDNVSNVTTFSQDPNDQMSWILDEEMMGTTDLMEALNAKGGTWQEDIYGNNKYMPTMFVGSVPSFEAFPSILTLGPRPIGGRMEAKSVMLSNEGSEPITITELDLVGDDFFSFYAKPEMPVTINGGESLEVQITTNPDVVTSQGEKSANLAIVWGNRSVKLVEVTSSAYQAVTPDIIETPQLIESFPFSTSQSTAEMYQNYNLPGSNSAGRDMVYKIVCNNDILLDAELLGADAKLAVYTEDFNGEYYPTAYNSYTQPNNDVVNSGGDTPIKNLVLAKGTYYLIASTTSGSFVLNVDAKQTPAPDASIAISPADGQKEVVTPVTLKWQLGNYTTEYQLLFGSNFPPSTILQDWTSDLATEYTVDALNNNTNYFWQVNVRNTSGITKGAINGFTTTMDAPTDLVVSDTCIYVGGSTEISWTPANVRSHRGYNVYADDVKLNTSVITENTFIIEGLDYNMEGYEISVKAVYDEGESLPATAKLYVSGSGFVNGHVYEQDLITPIAGVTINMIGVNEHGLSQTFTFTSDENGYYEGELYAGRYQGVAIKDGYQETSGMIAYIVYNETTDDVNFFVGETYTPVYEVKAEEIDASNINVYWSWDKIVPDTMGEDFETGDFSANEWNNEVSDYPWIIVEGGNESNYAMKSTCEGIDYGVSAIEITVEVPYDGVISFDYKISSEQTYDLGMFYIDDAVMATFSGEAGWANKQVRVTEGTHTYRWEYSKDIMWESGEDAFFVDNVVFYSEPEPFTGGWLHYDDGAYATSIGTGSPSPCYWGVAYPNTEEYAGYSITKLAVYDAAPDYAGTYTANVYFGGTDAPGTLVSTQTATLTGVADFAEIELSEPIVIDGSQPLWITFYTADITYPATGSSFCGDLNSDWISLDGTTWNHASTEYNLVYSWMIRAYLENSKGETAMLTTSNNAPKFEGGASTGTFVAAENVTPKYVGVPANETEMTRGNRAFSSYNVYFSPCYDEELVLLAENISDTNYVYTDWDAVEPGVYKWGVAANYAGNREQVVFYEEHFENPNPTDWTTYNSLGSEALYSDWVYMSRYSSYEPFDGDGFIGSRGNEVGGEYYLVSPAIDLTGVVGETQLSFYYLNKEWYGDLNELKLKISNSPTGPWTELWADSGESVKEWQNVTIDLAGYVGSELYLAFVDVNHYGYGTAIDNVTITKTLPISEITWSNPLDKDMITSVEVSAETNSGDPISGTKVSFISVSEPEMGYDVEFTLDETGYFETSEFRKGTYEITISKDGFISDVESVVIDIWEPTSINCMLAELKNTVEDLYVSPTGWAMWKGANLDADDKLVDKMSMTNSNKDNRALESYTIILNDHIEGDITDTYYQHEDLIVGEQYVTTVIANYTTGSSNNATYTWTYAGCDAFAGAEEFSAEYSQGNVVLNWTLPGSTPTPPDPSDDMSWDFESGLDGWTSIDADGDGNVWMYNVDAGLTGDDVSGNNGSMGFAFSQSYINYVGPLFPDNYFVSPSKIAVAAGTKISFYASAQDESYGAEHFGVAVSTSGNTSASDFTTISEWTFGSKGSGTRSMRQSAWVKYEADLSAYAGQEVYVAIRHFNCTDQFYLDIDDITISTSKNNREGEWLYYDNGVNMDAIGLVNGGSLYWGVMFPASQMSAYAGQTISKVSMFDYAAHTGDILIYEGGDNAPQTLLHTQDYTCTGVKDFIEVELSEAINVTGNSNIWVVLNNDNGQHVASCSEDTGDANGRWFSLDGSSWMDIAEPTALGSPVTWQIRAFIGDDDVTPQPVADILGTMVYRDGVLLTNQPIETTTFTDVIETGSTHEYCIRLVYDGGIDTSYYAMSCPQCETVYAAISCDAPVDLFAEQTGNDEVTLKLSYNPNPVGDWLYYDNGTNEDAIGGPAEFQWGIMFPAESLAAYEGTSFTKVSLFDYSASSGDIKVYYGGTNAPQELVHSQPYSVSGTGAFVEFDLTAALPVDPTMNVWVTFTTSQGTSYPAAVSANTGDPNGRWITLDGSVWEDIVDYGLSNTWMMRAYVTNAKGEVSSLAPIADEGFTATGGELAVAGAARATSALSHYNVYRGTSENNMTVIGETSTKTYVDSDVAEGTYYYAMTAVYEEGGETCESDPANAYGSDETFVVVTVTSIDENGVEGMMIYPNPTKDNVTISAENIERITITNALGQVMLDRVVNSDSEILNMGQYEAGVYMVRIVTANGVATERITVL